MPEIKRISINELRVTDEIWDGDNRIRVIADAMVASGVNFKLPVVMQRRDMGYSVLTEVLTVASAIEAHRLDPRFTHIFCFIVESEQILTLVADQVGYPPNEDNKRPQG